MKKQSGHTEQTVTESVRHIQAVTVIWDNTDILVVLTNGSENLLLGRKRHPNWPIKQNPTLCN